MIGIVGGAGPMAGNNLHYKIIEETNVSRDQDHLPVISWCNPSELPDRTEFLEGKVNLNPGIPISKQFLMLEKSGATVAAIPCNTAHAKIIYDMIQLQLKKNNSRLKLMSIIDVTIDYLKKNYMPGAKVGVLSTTGTWRQKIYKLPIEKVGFEVLTPTEKEQEWIHRSIYDPVFGIKATGSSISNEARRTLYDQSDKLIELGAEAIVLGCTEIPLVIKEQMYKSTEMLDTVRILSRALIKVYAPEKLKSI